MGLLGPSEKKEVTVPIVCLRASALRAPQFEANPCWNILLQWSPSNHSHPKVHKLIITYRSTTFCWPTAPGCHLPAQQDGAVHVLKLIHAVHPGKLRTCWWKSWWSQIDLAFKPWSLPLWIWTSASWWQKTQQHVGSTVGVCRSKQGFWARDHWVGGGGGGGGWGRC